MICRLCGREGTSGFITLYGTDDGDNIYRCRAANACERRQAENRFIDLDVDNYYGDWHTAYQALVRLKGRVTASEDVELPAESVGGVQP